MSDTFIDLRCACSYVFSALEIEEAQQALWKHYPSARAVAVYCPRCGKFTSWSHYSPEPTKSAAPLSAQETVLHMRHHVQLAIGELAKLARADLVTTPARNALEQRLYKALALADDFEPSTILNMPGMR